MCGLEEGGGGIRGLEPMFTFSTDPLVKGNTDPRGTRESVWPNPTSGR